MTERLVELEAARHLVHAHVMKGLLEECGITVVLENASLQGVLGEVPPGYPTSPRLLVPASQAEEARRILDEVAGRNVPAEE